MMMMMMLLMYAVKESESKEDSRTRLGDDVVCMLSSLNLACPPPHKALRDETQVEKGILFRATWLPTPLGVSSREDPGRADLNTAQESQSSQLW